MDRSGASDQRAPDGAGGERRTAIRPQAASTGGPPAGSRPGTAIVPATDREAGGKVQGRLVRCAEGAGREVVREIQGLPSRSDPHHFTAVRGKSRRAGAREGRSRFRLRLARAQTRRYQGLPGQVRLRPAERSRFRRLLPALWSAGRNRVLCQQGQPDR